jgi:hypothetical protein
MAVNIYPVSPVQRPGEQCPNAVELGDIVPSDTILPDVLGVEDALARGQDLTGIDRLDQKVVYPLSDGVLHQFFCFALCDHNHGNIGIDFPKFGQRRKAIPPGHHLIQQDHVEGTFSNQRHRIVSVCDRGHPVSPFGQKNNVRLQQVNFVVYPENLSFRFHTDLLLPPLPPHW